MSDTPTAETFVPGATYRTLLQLALLGTELNEAEDAALIATVLRELRPDLPQAGIVLAMNEFCTDKMDVGIQQLEQTLATFPDSQLAKAMLAVCLRVSGRHGWQPMLEEVIEDGRDEYAVGLSCAILGRANPMAGIDDAAAPNDSPESLPSPAAVMWA